MRGAGDFDDLTSYRHFIDEIVSRKNARQAKRIALTAFLRWPWAHSSPHFSRA
jgi:hypothetical protein